MKPYFLSTHFPTRLMCEHAYINTNPRAAGARIYPPPSVPTLPPGIDVTARLIEWDVSAVPELEGWIRDASGEMRLLLSQVFSLVSYSFFPSSFRVFDLRVSKET